MAPILLLKASALLAVTLAAARLLRRAPAVNRHRLWTVAFAAVLALPLLAIALPTLYVPMPSCCAAPAIVPMDLAAPASLTPHEEPVMPRGDGSRLPQDGSRAPSTAPRLVLPSMRATALVVWTAGTLAAAAVLLLSLVRVGRLAGAAERLEDAEWVDSAASLAARLGVRRRIRLFVSSRVGTPMAGGVWRPAIFLPASAREWSDERRDVVLAHEIAHLAGHDPLRHVAARLAVALYWFHPLAWMAARQAAAAREQACDEAVLSLGTRPSSYARVLLELAESLQPAPPAFGALPMVQRAHLETRVMAILNDDVRAVTRRGLVLPAAGFALCTVVLAAAQPAVPASARSIAITPPPATARATAPTAAVPPAASPAALPPQSTAGSACSSDSDRDRSFRGSTSTSRDRNGRTVTSEQVGRSDFDWIVNMSFGDLRVCMTAEGAVSHANRDTPSQWLGTARRIVLETRRGNDVQRLEVAPYGTGTRVSWQVRGSDRTVDAAAEQWRDRLLAVLDTTWELSGLRGEASSLRGEISSLRGQESSLRGEISSLHGEVSSMRGQQSSMRGEESSLRGEISSIRGHLSSLRGAISSEEGSISTLNAGSFRVADSNAIRGEITRHQNEIARLEREIRAYNVEAKVAAVQKQIDALATDKKVDGIDAEIRKFDLDGRVAAIEKQITALDVDGKTAAIEKQITALDVDRRGRQLEDRRDEEVKRLEAAIASIR